MVKRKLLNLFRKPFTSDFLGSKLSARLEKKPDSFWLRKLVPGNDLHSKDTGRLCKRFGVNFLLDLNDYQQWLLYFSDDNNSSLEVLSYVEPGFTVIDIGGNIGQTALAIAKKVGPSGKVISFEPYPETVRLFEKNLEINPEIKNIKLEKVGLGEVESTISFFKDCVTNSGGNRVLHSSAKNPVGIEQVTVTTLDNYSAKANLTKIDLIKIDVEGFEMSVMKGAKQTLLKFKPIMIVEVDENNLNNQGASSEELIGFLHKCNYKTIDLSDMQEFSMNGKSSVHTDIVCLPN